jgi:hypothetical protein
MASAGSAVWREPPWAPTLTHGRPEGRREISAGRRRSGRSARAGVAEHEDGPGQERIARSGLASCRHLERCLFASVGPLACPQRWESLVVPVRKRAGPGDYSAPEHTPATSVLWMCVGYGPEVVIP